MKHIPISKRELFAIVVVAVIALGVVACGGGTAQSQDAASPEMKIEGVKSEKTGPSVAWNPSSITFSAAPGTRQAIPVSFTVSANISEAEVSVAPTLRGLVKLSHSSFERLKKGQIATTTVIIAPSATTSLGVVQGTIEARADDRKLISPLPVQIIVATGAVGLLPPDPGEPGKATLAGVDSDNDGVRDDIERYIWLTYPGSAKQRASLLQDAIATQGLIVGTGAAQSRLAALSAAEDCFNYTFTTGDTDEAGGQRAIDIGHALTAMVVNTPNRVKAYAQSNGEFSGTMLSLTPYALQVSRCQIPPSSLPN